MTKRLNRVTASVVALGLFLLLGVVFWGLSTTDSIKIGVIAPLTGDNAMAGTWVRQGVELALDEINSAGGVRGKELEAVFEDSQLIPKTGVNAIKKLIFVDKVPAIVGAVGSSVTLAIAPIAESEKVVLVSPTSTNYKIKFAGDYIFRVVASDALQGKVLAEVAFEKLGARKIAILYMNNDYGVGLKEVFEKIFKDLGGEIIAAESFDGGDKDFRTQLSKINLKNPDIIFNPGHHVETGLALKQARELGMDIKFLGGDGSFRPELIDIAGNAAEGSIFTTMAWGTGVTDEVVQQFVADFKTKYDEEPGVFSALTYDATKVIALGIANGGETGPEIQQAIAPIQGFRGATGITTFDEFGEVDKPFSVFIVKEGDFRPYEPD